MRGVGGDELTRLVGSDERTEGFGRIRSVAGTALTRPRREMFGSRRIGNVDEQTGAAASAGEDAPAAASAVAPVSRSTASEGV